MKRLWRGHLLGRHLWIWAVLLVALALRWQGMLPERSMWEDEITSFWGSRLGNGYQAEALRGIYGISTHSYLTSFGLFRLSDFLLTQFGSFFVIRLPYLLLGLAMVWMGWRLGIVWKRWLTGLIVAVLLALWPFAAYWNTQVRFYSPLFLGGMAILLTWEMHYQRPRWWRFLLACAVTVFAPLNSIQGLPLIAIPWFFMSCDLLRRLYRGARVRFKAGRKTWLTPLLLVTQWAVLVVVCLGVVVLTRGEEWTRDTIGGLVADRPPATQTADRITERTGINFEYETPKLQEGINFLTEGITQTFRPYRWTAAALMGLEDRYYDFENVVFGYVKETTHPGDALNVILVVLLIVGTISLISISPAMALSTWWMILGISFALYLNQSVKPITYRYFGLPTLGLLILTGAGISQLANWLLWPLFRHRVKLAAYAKLATGFVLAAALIALFAGETYRFAKYEFQGWSDLYHEATRRYPYGVMFAGHKPENVRFHQDLYIFQEARFGVDNYWKSARRHEIANAQFRPQYFTGMAMIDMAADKQGIVYYTPRGFSGQFDLLAEAVPGFERDAFEYYPALKAVFYSLDDQVFVTKGGVSTPLTGRFSAPTEKQDDFGRRFEIKARYEVPGFYELDIAHAPHNPVERVWVNGQPVERLLMVNETSTEDGPAPRRRLPWPNLAQGRPGYPPHHPELPDWQGDLPYFTMETHSRTYLEVRGQPFAPQTITIQFKHALGEDKPVLKWVYLYENWAPINQAASVGDVFAWLGQDGNLNISPAIQVNQSLRGLKLIAWDSAQSLSIGETLTTLSGSDEVQRILDRGDVILPQALSFSGEQSLNYVGKELLILAETLPNFTPASPERMLDTRNAFIVCRLVFKEEQGRLNFDLLPPPDNP